MTVQDDKAGSETTELLVAILGELREIRRLLGGSDSAAAVAPRPTKGPPELRAAAALEIASRGLRRRVANRPMERVR